MSIETSDIGFNIDQEIREYIEYAEKLYESHRAVNNLWPVTNITKVIDVDPAWTGRLSNFDQMFREAANKWKTVITPQEIQQMQNSHVLTSEQSYNPEEWIELIK